MTETPARKLTTASRISDVYLRPVAALLAPLAVWVSMAYCHRLTFTPCSEWGCAETAFTPAGCVPVAGHGVERWALGVLALAFTVCAFGGVHRA